MALTLSKFFFDIPIYETIQVPNTNISLVQTILDPSHKEEFDGYNPWKKFESTFIVYSVRKNVVSPTMTPTRIRGKQPPSFTETGGYATILVKCKRSGDECQYLILWDSKKQELTKLGQHPSLVEFHSAGIKQYGKILPSEKLKEFSRGIGLAAHGIGIGSFVYLRRIFEHLIQDAYEDALRSKNVTAEEYKGSRMDDRIVLLKKHLPEFLVQNRSIYSILSKGIHELDKDTCLNHFATLKVGIELILY